MPAPKGRKFRAQPLQVVCTPDMRDRIVRIAEREEVSQASVVRDIIEKGLPARERKSLNGSSK